MSFKPNLLCIVPPYSSTCPPAGAAALLGYLAANGCDDFGFLDLRLHGFQTSPHNYAPTYRPSGVFGESFVIDVPDLPLVLHVLAQYDAGRPLCEGMFDDLFVDYCIGRGIHPHSLAAHVKHMDRFLEVAFAQVPDLRFIGFSVWTSNLLTTVMAACHLKRRRNPPFIVCGGPQVTESPNSAKLGLRARVFDAVALGEGEETLLSLYEAYCAGGRLVDKPIAGAMQVDSATGAFTSSPRTLLRLKELPLPDFSGMAIARYRSRSGGRELPYQLSRGCTDKCSFCSESVFWQKYRIGSMSTAVDHIGELIRRYGAEVIHFTDSLLNGTKARLREFAETMLSRDVAIPWFGFMRADIDADTANLVRRAGCVQAFIGIESLSDETLAAMNKRRTEADNIRALRLFLEAGIRVVAGIIPGFPGDTRERFLHTARSVVELQERYPGLLETNTEPFILSPGQPIYREVGACGLELQPWSQAVLDRAGKYSEIAAQVACTFTGPNQGVDRLGELRIAKTLLGSRFYGEPVDDVPSPFDLEFEHVYKDVFLTRTPSAAGHAYALLLTHSEKELYQRMRSAESLLPEQNPFEPVTERSHYLAFWTKLEQQHAICGARDSFTITPTSTPESVADDARLRPGSIVARVFGSDLLIVNVMTLMLVRLPALAAPWLAAAARGARTRREIDADAVHARLSIDLDDLIAKGLLDVVGAVAPSPTFVGRTPRVVLPAPAAAPVRNRLPIL